LTYAHRSLRFSLSYAHPQRKAILLKLACTVSYQMLAGNQQDFPIFHQFFIFSSNSFHIEELFLISIFNAKRQETDMNISYITASVGVILLISAYAKSVHSLLGEKEMLERCRIQLRSKCFLCSIREKEDTYPIRFLKRCRMSHETQDSCRRR
jgi:hypothetical protein